MYNESRRPRQGEDHEDHAVVGHLKLTCRTGATSKADGVVSIEGASVQINGRLVLPSPKPIA
jgi:hypothetical protein